MEREGNHYREMFDFWTIFLAVVVGILYIWWKNTTRDAVLPPGPPTVPFLGNLLSVNPETVLDTFQEYRRKYGEVFSLITGSKTLVVISGYDTLREIFIKHGDVTSERPDIFITREVGKFKGTTEQFYFEKWLLCLSTFLSTREEFIIRLRMFTCITCNCWMKWNEKVTNRFLNSY